MQSTQRSFCKQNNIRCSRCSFFNPLLKKSLLPRMPNHRHAQHEDSAWTQPPTPHLHRNLSFSTGNTSTRVMRQYILQSQTSVAIDQPIEPLDPCAHPEAESETFTTSEGLWPIGPRESLYASYLRRRLREIRPSSLDEGIMQGDYSKGSSTKRRRKPLVARALSVDNPYFGEPKGTILFLEFNSTFKL